MTMWIVTLCCAFAEDGNGVQKAIEALSTATGYRFTFSGNVAQVEAVFQKDAPLYVKADQIEFFRKGDVLVYRQGDQWQRTRTGTVSDPLRILGASAKVRAVRLPHEELSVVIKARPEWKKSEERGRAIWSANLDEPTAKQLAPTEDRDVARSATVKVALDAQGQVTNYEIAVRVQGRRGNAEVDGTVMKSVSLRDIGKTKLEISEGARKALEQRLP